MAGEGVGDGEAAKGALAAGVPAVAQTWSTFSHCTTSTRLRGGYCNLH